MRNYELMWITPNELTDSEVQGIMDRVEVKIKEEKGKVYSAELWDRREMSYRIKDFDAGAYCLAYFTAPADSIESIKLFFKSIPQVIRHLILSLD